MERETSTPNPNWALLSGLRFLLAMVVVSVHLPVYSNPSRIFNFIAQTNGAVAVFAFLVISGFSIRASLCKEVKGFYARRIVRIYPLYFLSIVFASVAMFLYGPVLAALNQNLEAPTSIRPFLINALGLQSVLAPALRFNSPSWSLGIEIFCYACAPLLLKLKNHFLIALMIASALIYFNFPPYTMESYGFVTVAEFVWAWLLGWMIYDWKEKAKQSPLLVLGVLAFLCFAASSNQSGGQLWPLLFIALVAVIFYGEGFSLTARAKKVCLYLGELSYPLYILHFPTGLILWKSFGITSPYLHLAAYLTVASLAYHLLDKPMRTRAARLSKAKQVQMIEPTARLALN